VKAQCQLGLAYQFGRGVGKDMTQAKYWLKKADEQVNTEAGFSLGNIPCLERTEPGAKNAYQPPKPPPEDENWEGVHLKDFVIYREGERGFIAYFVLGKGNGEMVARKGKFKLTIRNNGNDIKTIEKNFVKSSFHEFTTRLGENIVAYRFDRTEWHECKPLPENGSNCRFMLEVYSRQGGMTQLQDSAFRDFRAEY
jgi:TPR repeat protein